MEKTLLAIGLLMLVGTLYNVQTPVQVDVTQKFNNYMTRFNKIYTETEKQYRMQVYFESLKNIEEKNAQNGPTIYGETPFTDLTQEEFVATYLTLRIEQEDLQVPKKVYESVNATPIDWRSRGAVTEVKNQGNCGSCWTFGTTGVLEGFFKVTTGELPNLSEQQLLDCSTWVDLNFGCNGGMPSRALGYVKRHGITTQEKYPYNEFNPAQGDCKTKQGDFHINGHTALDASEAALTNALQTQPVSVAVDATNWKDYKEGVFEDCDSALNHAVLAVGFTHEHIIIKNSWTADWGNKGYIHIKAGKNTCGVWDAMVVPN